MILRSSGDAERISKNVDRHLLFYFIHYIKIRIRNSVRYTEAPFKIMLLDNRFNFPLKFHTAVVDILSEKQKISILRSV